MKSTGIQWADDTVNPTTGCDGCELWIPGRGGPCYAGNLHESRLALSLPNLYTPVFTEVRTAPGRMRKIANCMDLAGKERPGKPWLNRRRRLIFLGDLGDIFSKGIPFEYLRSELIDIARSKQGMRHDWLCLTKQPQRAVEFAHWLSDEWPANIWVGTSVTGKASLRRLDHLAKHPATVRFISLEPQIEDVDLTPWLGSVSWVIQGGESDQSPYIARPFELEWAERVLADCTGAGVAYFLKQLGSKPRSGGSDVHCKDSHGGEWDEWPEHLRVRQTPFSMVGSS